jgi:integrase
MDSLSHPPSSIVKQESSSEAYKNFINSIDSEATKTMYNYAFSLFMQFCGLKEGGGSGTGEYDDDTLSAMLQLDKQKIEDKIRDYITFLRVDKKLSSNTINVYVAAIAHFYSMNNVILNWKRLSKFKGKKRLVVEDKPYTKEQIRRLLEFADLRVKCMILLMCSAGLRRGALTNLRIEDLEKIDKYSLYKISVYKNEQESYFTFCTPECANLLDEYFDYRARLGEKLHAKSLVLRREFSTLDAARPQPLEPVSVSWHINELLDKSGIRPRSEKKENNKDQRTSLMQCHGFRKFFDTTCTLNGMDGLYVEKLMGHDIGIKAHYFKPSSQELLEGNEHKMGYESVIDALTINEENRLRRENEILKVNKSEIEQLKEQAEAYKSFMATFNPQIEEFQREINNLKLHLNSEASNKKNNKKRSSSNKKQTEDITTDGA